MASRQNRLLSRRLPHPHATPNQSGGPGQVQRPGLVLLDTDMRVVDAITSAGGFTVFANRKRIKILRRAPDGSVTTYGFNYDAFVSGSAPGSNGLLEPDDTVVVPD